MAETLRADVLEGADPKIVDEPTLPRYAVVSDQQGAKPNSGGHTNTWPFS